MVVVGSVRSRFSMDSEAVQAGVFGVTPVGQHPHFDYLERLVILLLRGKKWKISGTADKH